MKRTNLLLVCGLAAAISSPAMAQTGNQPGERPQPGQQPGQQDQDRQERQSRLGQSGQQDASNILKQLEGSWHIEIKMDPQLFGQASTSGADRSRTLTPGQDRDQTDPTRDRDPADPMRDRDDPTQPDRTERPGEPGQPSRTLGADQEGMVTSRGYSQNRLILNDKVLHEAAVIINSGQEGAAAGQSGSEQIQALTFLGFDEQSKKYSFVIMTDRSGKFNCNHGEIDSGQKKITFEKEGRQQGMSGMRGQPGQSKLDNVKIVLEIVSNDEHKVTMYDTSASGQSGLQQRQQEEGRTPGADRPGQQPDRSRPGQDVEGKVVYEATYTRADGEQPGQPGQMPGQQRPGQTPGQTPGGGQ